MSTSRSRCTTMTSSRAGTNTTTSSSPIAMARRFACAISAARSMGRRTGWWPAWQNGKRGILLIIFKQPGANVIDTVERIKQALPRLEASIPPSIHVSTIMDRTKTIRASVSDVEFTLLLPSPGGDGDLPVPAQRVGDAHPEHDRAGGADRHLRRDVRAGLQPRQPVADGVDAGSRVRDRRRHRHAGEHLPPRGRGHETDGGGDQGRRRNRLHDRVDQLLAGRGVHPAAVHGRHRRAAVPRIRHDGTAACWCRHSSA